MTFYCNHFTLFRLKFLLNVIKHMFTLTLLSPCRNLVALSRQLARQRATDEGVSLTGRHCLILCVLLLSQLLLNYVFT